jgi:hypothetical protein
MPPSRARLPLEELVRPGAATSRLGDDRYCAPCGVLFWSVTGADGATAHRRAAHPEQARYEPTTTQEAPA